VTERRVPGVDAEYKVAETSTVTDEELERILNEHSQEGWTLDDIHFVTKDSSHRPVMAFITFTRSTRTREV